MVSAKTAAAPARARAAALPWLIAIAPAAVFVAAFLAAPSLLLLMQSFTHYNPAMQSSVGGFTLENYRKALLQPLYVEVLLNTLRLSAIVTGLCLVAGYPIAFFIARSRSRFAAWYSTFVLVPLFVSIVIRAFGWMVVLGPRGPANALLLAVGAVHQPVRLLFTDIAVIIGLVHILSPYMIMPIASVLRGIDPAVDEAALSLGAGRLAVFRRVILPLSMPGIVAGAVLVYAHSIAAFVLPAMLGSIQMKLIATMLYQQVLVLGNVPLGAALAIVLIAVTLALVALVYRVFGIRAW